MGKVGLSEYVIFYQIIINCSNSFHAVRIIVKRKGYYLLKFYRVRNF